MEVYFSYSKVRDYFYSVNIQIQLSCKKSNSEILSLVTTQKSPNTEFVLVRIFAYLDRIHSKYGKMRTRKNSAFGGHFFYMNIVHTNKYNKKLKSPGALNIKETPGYKQKENVKNNVRK